jgi:hypothetical protein
MATPDEYLRLRRMTGEVEESTYTNADLDLYIAQAGSLEGAAARIWGEKASGYADLVNMNEAGSQRSLSDLFKHAKEQQAYYEGLAGTGSAVDLGTTTTRPIRRA